ncbi:MAG TPA: aspartate/glutamate racemase family protein, partial [Paenirhodobacter sp.]
VGRAFVARYPDIGALVLECTNLAPHARALQQATGLPVFDSVTLVNWFHAALCSQSWLHA